MKRLVIVVAVALVGCVSHLQFFVTPEGQRVTCQSSGGGLIGVAHADHIQKNCEREARAAGYLEIERAGVIGITLEDSTLRVIKVIHGSPAAAAGIKVEDVLVSVGGVRVSTRESAMLLLFGRAGYRVTIVMRRGELEMPYTILRAPFPEVYGTGR